MSSNIGEALLKIIVDIQGIGTSEQKLLSFFNSITQMASGAAASLTGAAGAATSVGTAFTAAATGARTLAQNVTLLNAALNGTAAAAGAGAAGASRNINGVAAAIQRGIDIARLGEAANRKYARSMQDLAQPWARGMLTTRESRRGSMNLEKERRGDTFSEALSRSQLKTDPVREHFTKRADELSKKVVSGALSAEQAIARYNKEVRKMGVQGIFTQQGQKLRTLTIMTDRLTAAQEKYNAAQRAKAIEKGIALADPRQAAATKLASNISNIQAAAGAGAISSKQAASEIAKLNSEFRKTYSSMGMFEAKMEGIAFKTSMFSSSLRTAGRQLMMFAGVIAAAITPAVVASAKFEQAVQNVAAVLDGIGDKTVLVRQLSDQFLDLGERSEFTAVQVAEAAKELAKAGFSAREVQGSLEGVVNLASAAGVSLKEAAEVAANLTRAFQLPAESFGTVADKLVAMANKSTADVRDLASAFKYVSPIASAFGQSIDDVGASLMVLANTGNTGSRAGTGLSRFFSELVEPRKVAKLKVLLESVGESIDQLSPDENSMRDMFALLDRLMATKQISAADISGIFDQRSARAVLAILGQGIEKFDEAKDFLEDDSAGLAQATREARLDTLMGDWLKFTSALNTAMIKLGDTVNNPIRDMLQYLTSGLQSASKTMDTYAGGIIKFLASMSAMAAGAGVLVTALGSLIAVFGAFALSVSVAGGPLTAIIAIITALAAALSALYVMRQFEIAEAVRKGLKEMSEEMKDTTKVIRDTSKEVDTLTTKLGLLRNLATLKPIQIRELFKGDDPFGVNQATASIEKLEEKRKELQQKRSQLEAEYWQTWTGASEMSAVQAGVEAAIVRKKSPLQRLQPTVNAMAAEAQYSVINFFGESEAATLKAQIAALKDTEEEADKLIASFVAKRKELFKSLELGSLSYEDAFVALEKTSAAIKEQEDVVTDLTTATRNDPSQKDALTEAQRILEVRKAEAEQLKGQLGAGISIYEVQRELSKEQLKYMTMLINKAPEAALASQADKVAELADSFAGLTKEQQLAKQAAAELVKTQKELGEIQTKIREENLSESEKKLAEMDREAEAALVLADRIARGTQQAYIEARDELTNTEREMAVPELTAEKRKENEKKLPDLRKAVEARKKDAEAAAKVLAELPMQLANRSQDFATKSQQEQADKVADMTQKAALAVAQKNHNMAEEIRLTKEIAERERDRNREALKAEKASDQEIKAFENSETARIAQEVADIQEKYTTQYLEDIDKVNLEIAKKTNNLKEELRLTEKLRQAEIAKKALEVDPAIRQQWIDAQQQQLQTELDDIRRNAGDKSPVKNQLSQIENRSDDLLKKRVENQDKIRDALAQQVKTLYDAQMLNNYLFKVERARESWKEQARTKALADAKRLQGMADRGGNSWAIASQFSRAAASLDTARASGVSNLALSPAANVLSGIPMNIPVQPVRAATGGGGTNINSNNNTLTIEKGAIVINGASDSEKVAAVVVDTIKDMFSGKGPKRGK
jgi:TP901 family phage tail tape measure protein